MINTLNVSIAIWESKAPGSDISSSTFQQPSPYKTHQAQVLAAQLSSIHLNFKRTRVWRKQLSVTHFNPSRNTTNSTCKEKVTGLNLINFRNTVQTCQQLKILVLCCIRSRMVSLLKFTDFPIQVSSFLLLICWFQIQCTYVTNTHHWHCVTILVFVVHCFLQLLYTFLEL